MNQLKNKFDEKEKGRGNAPSAKPVAQDKALSQLYNDLRAKSGEQQKKLLALVDVYMRAQSGGGQTLDQKSQV